MKKQPKAVYIIENGGYTELSYEEFRRREQICPLYADKLFLPLYGSLMEVSKEDSLTVMKIRWNTIPNASIPKTDGRSKVSTPTRASLAQA